MRKEKYIKIEKRNGNTYFRVYFRYGEGKVYSKSFAANDYQSEAQALNAACQHRDLMRAELITHGIPDYKNATVKYLFDEYERLYVNRYGTHKLHSAYFDKYISADYGDCDITKLSARDVMVCLNKYVYECTDANLSKIRSIWSEIFKMARLDRVIMVNPMEEVVTPPSQVSTVHRSQYCTTEDVEKICEYLESGIGARNYEDVYNQKVALYLVRFMEATGCRPAEAFAISRKTSYDFSKKVIYINKQYGTTKDGPGIVKPKAHSIREIPMTPDAERVLRAAEQLSPYEYIFKKYSGEFMTTYYLSHLFKAAKEKTGITFHPYMLRHMMATDLIKETGDIRATMEIMGHTGKTAAQSLDYARSDSQSKASIMNLVENARKSS